MQFVPYPKKRDTSSRKTRKTERNRVFIYNHALAAQARREKKLVRQQAEEELTEE